MKPVHQTIFDADSGNCLSACIASILELAISDVPAFAEMYGGNLDEAVVKWLRGRGLRLIELGFADCHTFANTYFGCIGEFCIVSGPSTYKNRAHAVVGQVNKDGAIEIVHDPIPGGNGPLEGHRWVSFIVPTSKREGMLIPA